MSTAQFVGVRLDDEVVILDLARAALVLLDARSAKLLELCDGRTFTELTAELGCTRLRLVRALRDLGSAGLVGREGERWMRAPVRNI